MNYRPVKKSMSHGRAIRELSRATVQASGIGQSLKEIQEVFGKALPAKELLDKIILDYQTLSAEVRFLRFLLTRTTSLTPDAEAQYRREFEMSETRE